ncbi:MAG: ComF family protein [Clostridia bacterium]|nr:ComF family protein [Clostridia bacterium]
MKSRLRAWMDRAAEWLFPRGACCLCCGDPRRASEEDCLCDACREKLKEGRVPAGACNRCLSPVSPGKPCAFCASPMMKPIEAVFSPYRFGGETRALIHALKFDACEEAAPLLAQAMADALPRRDFDCIVPVPLHPARLRQRGFNQTLILGRELSVRTGISVEDLLRRDRYHAPQSRLPMKRRADNVRGAFSCIGDSVGKRVLLLDDVRTTGSTACACAQTLLNAGAESVCLCVSAVVYRKARGG